MLFRKFPSIWRCCQGIMHNTNRLTYSKLHYLRLMTKTRDPFDSRASGIIDVRAPLEYQHDHIPDSLNFPVLSDEQRAVVGKLYKEKSFEARKLGAGLISGSISKHIENYFGSKPPNYRPLIYCWRGGQRSQSLAIVLSQIGFEVLLLEKGYRAYRKRVVDDLQELPHKHKYIVLTGLTGTGKTQLLQRLQRTGAQVLDLENLARHKGSLLGGRHEESQPSQKMWESQIRQQLASFDPNVSVWLESESSTIGRLKIPSVLFRKMCEAERIEVCMPLDQRVRNILEDYPQWTEDVSLLKSVLLPLKRIRGQNVVDNWFKLADHNLWQDFVRHLLVEHYDITYKVSQKKNTFSDIKTVVHLHDLSEKSQMEFLESIEHLHSVKYTTDINNSG